MRRAKVLTCIVALMCLTVAQACLVSAAELTIYTMPHDRNPEKNEARVAAWKEANPEYSGVDVSIVAGWAEQLKVMAAGGTPPDIVFYSSSQVPEFAYNKLIMPLDDFMIRDPDFSKDGFIPDVLATTEYKSQTFGLPVHWSAVATMYNADLLDERGIGTPGADWTWDDFLDFGKKATFDENGDNNLDHFGFGDHWIHQHRWPYWVWAGGGDFYNENLTRSLLNEEGALRGIEFMVSLYDENKIAAKVIGTTLSEPGVTTSASGGGISNDLFGQGRMAFFNTTRFSYPPDATFTVGVLQPPIGPGGRTSVAVSDFYGIHPTSDVKETAWSFIAFASRPENAPLGFEPGVIGALSAQADVAIAMLEDAPELSPMNWVRTAEDSKRPSLFHPALGIIDIDWTAIARGDVAVRDAVDEAVKTHNAELLQRWNEGDRW